MDLIVKIAKRQPVTDDEIADELFSVCDRVHASCDDDCPVYLLNGSKTVGESDECECFKDGHRMLEFIRDTCL